MYVFGLDIFSVIPKKLIPVKANATVAASAEHSSTNAYLASDEIQTDSTVDETPLGGRKLHANSELLTTT